MLTEFQDGKLAAEPVLIEASASMKGPLLRRDRRATACQPYAMLPLDRYREWKVLASRRRIFRGRDSLFC
jgi:hypothetical protein